jgi:DNA polymerase (family 10)
LAGFGKKTQQRIIASIERYRRHRTRTKLDDADRYAAPLLERLLEHPAVQQAAVAGSIRRRCETVGDINLLVATADPETVIETFATFADVERVENSTSSEITVVLASGIKADLCVVSAESSSAAALAYLTGSKQHNEKLRSRADEVGLRLSRVGLYRSAVECADSSTAELVDTPDESAFYRALGLQWIAPELREDRGEIEAAVRDELPKLITIENMRGDLQMHSTWSDGKETIEVMLKACVERGYDYFAITDHSKALAMTGGLDEVKLREQWAEIEDIAGRHGEIKILRGMEVDILADGRLDLQDEMLAQLDVVLISVHSRFDLPEADQTDRMIKAIQHPSVNILAHPTGRQINRRDPMKFDLDTVLGCAAECNVAVELNANPNRLDLSDVQLLKAREFGLKIVISTDAHSCGDLGFMRYGIEQARRAWVEQGDVLNTLQYDELLAALRSV